MRIIFSLIIAVLLFACNSEPKPDGVIKNLQPEMDTVATQFNPAHHDPTDSTGCRNVDNETGAGEECEIQTSSISREFINLKRENRIDGIDKLSDTLPSENKAVEINSEGLISAEYKWEGKEKLVIILSYDGGVTEIDLTQNGPNLKRAIYYSAD